MNKVYFADLTPYEYLRAEPNTLNVGWLDEAHEFPKGNMSKVAIQRLRTLARTPVNLTLGLDFVRFVKSTLAVISRRWEKGGNADRLVPGKFEFAEKTDAFMRRPV